MPKFSKHFRINAPQSQLDFVDINTDFDTPVYVDPYAIEIRNDVWSAEASDFIRIFFLEVLNALKSGDDSRAKNLMSHLHEPYETYLGVSEGKPQGKGVGAKQSLQMINAIKGSAAFKSGLLSDLSEMALFVDHVDRDKISDLTTNIIRKKLVQYTQEQCSLYGIPLQQHNGPPAWDAVLKNWRSEFFDLPHIEDEPVILVPKYIVRKRLSLDSQSFYNKQITDFLMAEHVQANSSLVTLLKGKPKILKKDVRAAHPKSKKLISEIVAKKPTVLAEYKQLASNEKLIMVNTSDDDQSVSQSCIDLIKELATIPTGASAADKYHMWTMRALTICFYPDLIQPHKEWEINDGRKRIDIVFTNAANQGFFAQRRDANNTAATMVIVECKNYSKDIVNPEIDQLLGRFDNNRGRFGIMTCRSVENEDRLLARQRDLAKGGQAFILTLTDQDFVTLLDAKAHLKDNLVENILHQKFREIIS